ncbi:hypothetical protein ACQKLP_05495 [Chitinophaga sp. NPDC101104]|uniref:hypothetical protein n=1 Tax=Chitinophaga sp. NPDC101104 TaxID=3390561 RepID=UPI003CFDA688
MYNYFSRTIQSPEGEKNATFSPTYYGDVLYYSVKIDNVDQFRMTRDDSSQWKIAAQVLPIWVHEKELELHDMIEEEAENS